MPPPYMLGQGGFGQPLMMVKDNRIAQTCLEEWEMSVPVEWAKHKTSGFERNASFSTVCDYFCRKKNQNETTHYKVS